MKRRTNKKLRHLNGGGCGFQSSSDVIMKGGSDSHNGTFFNINNKLVNPINTYENDPSDPSSIMSVRIAPNIISGGKRKSIKRKSIKRKSNKRKSNKRKSNKRKQKGGSDQVMSSQYSNIISCFNTVAGTPITSNVLNVSNDQTLNLPRSLVPSFI